MMAAPRGASVAKTPEIKGYKPNTDRYKPIFLCIPCLTFRWSGHATSSFPLKPATFNLNPATLWHRIELNALTQK